MAAQAGEFGAHGNRIAVGVNMTAAISMMTKDRYNPKISYQVLLIPATTPSVDTELYHSIV